MAATPVKISLFSAGLSTLFRDLLIAWNGILTWPVMGWLVPKFHVRLWLPSGQAVSSFGPGTPRVKSEKKLTKARFDALLLPERLILRRSLTLPQLQSRDMMAALSLQVQELSPFSAADLVWTHELETRKAAPDSNVHVQLILTSRQLIASYASQTHPDIKINTTEIWLPSTLSPGELLLPGFGEASRLRKKVAWRRINVFLAIVVMTLLMTMAITPTAQLYVRAHQAFAAMTVLQKQAAPLLQQREHRVMVTEQLLALTGIADKSPPPQRVLKLITDVLPDDTSLLSLQINGPKVVLTGQTPDTTSLMKLLGTKVGLRDVIAPNAAIKPLGATRESFTIEFVIEPSTWHNIKPEPIQAAASAPEPAKAAASAPEPAKVAASAPEPAKAVAAKPASSK